MDKIYQDYINQIPNDIRKGRNCREVTKDMQLQFPELNRVKGHYLCLVTNSMYTHWWMESKEGDIIDPTSEQFTFLGGVYLKYEGEEPTGKCLNCGNLIYNYNFFCSDICRKQNDSLYEKTSY
jgi:hypothetical protein